MNKIFYIENSMFYNTSKAWVLTQKVNKIIVTQYVFIKIFVRKENLNKMRPIPINYQTYPDY